MSHKISCVIPAYNEEKNISRVLDAVQQFPLFNEIIVIDDGSLDHTKKIVKEFKNIKLIENKTNLGKSGAIIKGINKSQGDIIVMNDADLINLTHKNLNSLITPLLKKEYALTILDRAGDRSPIWGWTDCARLFGGERAFWKKDFLELPLKKDSGYLLETVMNKYYIRKKAKIKTIYCPNLYTVHQFNKVRKKEGIINYFKMARDILSETRIKGIMEMTTGIEEDRISLIYKFKNKFDLGILVNFIIFLFGISLGIVTFLWQNIKLHILMKNPLKY